MKNKPRDFGDARFLKCVRDSEYCKHRISKLMTIRRNFYQMNIITGIVFFLSVTGSQLGHIPSMSPLFILFAVLGLSIICFYKTDIEIKTLKSIYVIYLKDSSNAAEQDAAANP